jgi:hypothetical protein
MMCFVVSLLNRGNDVPGFLFCFLVWRILCKSARAVYDVLCPVRGALYKVYLSVPSRQEDCVWLFVLSRENC